MPVKKKSDAAEIAAANAVKPVAKKSPSASAKPAAKRSTKPATAAATHKAPARRSTSRKSPPVFDVELHRAEIEREAFLIWSGRGYEHGQAHEDWLTAIELVKTRHQG